MWFFFVALDAWASSKQQLATSPPVQALLGQAPWSGGQATTYGGGLLTTETPKRNKNFRWGKGLTQARCRAFHDPPGASMESVTFTFEYSADTELYAVTGSLNGVELNGVELNGVELNGVELNGVELNIDKKQYHLKGEHQLSVRIIDGNRLKSNMVVILFAYDENSVTLR